MPSTKELKPVQPQPGKPLYLVAKERIREAIDANIFGPGEQMPSTKELSDQLEVSLVTAHRALQELVNAGILQRSQGKGTFVHQAYLEGRPTIGESRVGLILNRAVSFADFYHGNILEGIRQAAQEHNVDLVLLRFDEDVRKECDGFLCLSPGTSEIEAIEQKNKAPIVIVGASADQAGISSITIDSAHLARQAVNHLSALGHSSIAYVGGAEEVGDNRDRWNGFAAALADARLASRPQWVLKSGVQRLPDRDRQDLARILAVNNRPAAVFAAGYFFALDVYAAAEQANLTIGRDLAVMGVDDPASAALLSPPLTTFRQPLVEMGKKAVETLLERMRQEDAPPLHRALRAELVVRNSAKRA